MLRSTKFDTLLGNCTHVEQVLDLSSRALYDRYPSQFITTGIDGEGVDIRTPAINHWSGNQLVAENTVEEQTITTFVTPIDKSHKAALTPWLLVSNVGSDTDTPNGIFA
jgi:hypothetical protein